MAPPRTRRLAILAFPLLIILAFQSAYAERLPIKVYTTADGLPSNNINKIVHDSRGFLWFCTVEGLSLFDGQTFVNFGIDDGLPRANVTDILETRDGEYWVATTGGLCRFRPRKYAQEQDGSRSENESINATKLFELVIPPDDDSRARVANVLLQSRDGTIWCGTYKGLFQVKRNRNKVELVKVDIALSGDEGSLITALLEDRQGALWVGTAKDLHRRWEDGTVSRFGKDFGLPDDNIHDLLQDRNGKLWIATRFGGLIELTTNGTKDPPHIDRIFNAKNGLGANWVFDIYESFDGRLFVGTNTGLAEFAADEKLRAAPIHLYSKRNGFSYHEIANLNEDRDGDLWLGTANGAMKLAHEGFVTFDEKDGLDSSVFLFQSAKGELNYFGYVAMDPRLASTSAISYASNYRAVIGRYDGRAFSWLLPNIGSNWCSWSTKTSILEDHWGQWWVGTTDGVFVFPAVKTFSELAKVRAIAHYTKQNGLGEKVVFALHEDSQGNIWISTISKDGGSTRLARWERSSKTFQNIWSARGLPELKDLLAHAFQEDQSGNMWIGFNQRGIGRYKNGHFNLLGPGEGLPAGPINDLFLDQQGRLWIATARGGLSLIEQPNDDHPTIANYNTAKGLSSNQVSAITQDLNGRIYIATGRGVDQLTPVTGRIKHFTTADGLASGEIFDALCDKSGMLWFATSQGLSKFLPKAAAPMAPPPIFIKGLRLGGEKQAISPLGETDIALQDIQPGNNQLQIDFVGVSFAPGEGVVYQYKFDGTDPWSVPSEQSTITFASLASGHYRLLVRAIGSDGVTSLAPAIITFTVLRPLWQRWWFILLTVASLSFIAYSIYRSRVSRLLEVERVRTRIATDLHDDIGANLTKIAILSEVARQQLGNGGPEQDRPLSSIARISREAVASMSDIVWAINPQRDHLPDLLGRMRQHAEESCLPREIELSFDDGDSEVDLHLGVGVRRDLFLIFKEAVSNAVRHSNCNHLWITISLERNLFSLKIRDDGDGFETEAKHEGNGLLNLKRRAAKLSGQLSVKSIAHHGTTIKFSFPVRRERFLSLPTRLRR